MTTLEYRIAEAIIESIDGTTGNFSIEIEVNEKLIEVSGWYEFDGYTEDDYFSGTGAWVATSATVCITNCNSDIDTERIERYVGSAEKPLIL